MNEDILSIHDFGGFPLWENEIERVEGHNLEVKGRGDVNSLLSQGWKLLLIYTLKYKEEDIWRERPMAILGKPKSITKTNFSLNIH
jgi:hypothetical protein